ncbi:MAG TPA: ABC transporter permease [Candidatus Sulfotelmatobacter sp.]|nr:ABC transporter permease [Candidatus Sulfotelmatobacter sp.]
MRWTDTFKLVSRSISRRAARTALTGLGVALGSGLLVALVTISSTADTNVIARLSHGGPVAAIKVAAAAPQPNQLDSDTIQSRGIHILDDQSLAAIRRLPNVSSVVPVMTSEVLAVSPGVDPDFGLMIGTDMNQVANLPITILAGRMPSPDSLTEVAISSSYLDHLQVAPADAPKVLGREIELATPRREPGAVQFHGRWFRATIVGVVAQQVSDGDFVVPIKQTELARQWALAGEPDPDFPLLQSQYTGLVVVASSLDQVHQVRAEIDGQGYATSAPEHLVATVQRYLSVVDIVLGGIGTVALGIAVLSIAGTLLTALQERRREIGVLKAIGARDRDVLRWFLAEALAVGIGGGIAGSLAGIGVAELLGVAVNNYLVQQGLGGIDLTTISWTVVLGGVAGATFLALLAAAVPALVASRVSAREAVAGE